MSEWKNKFRMDSEFNVIIKNKTKIELKIKAYLSP